MPIWITDSTGIINKQLGYPEPVSDEHAAAVGATIEVFNKNCSKDLVRHAYRIASITFPPVGTKLVAGELVDLSISEKAEHGILENFNPETQIILEGKISPKSDQQLVNDGVKSLATVKGEARQRISYEIAGWLENHITSGGYSMSKLIMDNVLISPEAYPEAMVTEMKAVYSSIIAAQAASYADIEKATTCAGIKQIVDSKNYLPK